MKKKVGWLCFAYGWFSLAVLHSCASDSSRKGKTTALIPTIESSAAKNQIDFSAMSGNVTDSISCSGQPQLNYCLYLPSYYSVQKTFPIIFIFDAHADGKLPVSKYQSLAEEFGFVLAGSNNSKNGIPYDSLVNMAREMMQDVSVKISTDGTRRYVMGFSGGARVAGVVASTDNTIAGVIGCGAAYMDESYKSRPGLFCFGFAAKDDFNLLEMFRMHEYFEQAGIKNYLEVFEGKHEWPDSETMRNAFEMLTLTSPEKRQALEKKVSVAGVNPSMAKAFEEESIAQKKYIDAFLGENIFWWKNEISNLQACGNKNRDKEKQHHCKRLLAYTGVAVYSFSNNAIKSYNDTEAEKLLQIYNMVDSQNSEQRYLEAILRVRQGNNYRAFALLNEAVNLGFSDLPRIEGEPDFQKLRGMDEYRHIIDKIKTPKP